MIISLFRDKMFINKTIIFGNTKRRILLFFPSFYLKSLERFMRVLKQIQLIYGSARHWKMIISI